MKYSGSLANDERAGIFRLFAHSVRLKFNEIEKMTAIRSNKLAYHIALMTKEGILAKKDDSYELTAAAETYLPVISHITGRNASPVPVVVVAIIKKGRILLIKRNNRPYKDYWALVGGKINLEETLKQAGARIVKQKTGLEAENMTSNAVLHERVFSEETVKHGFILFFLTATTARTKPFKTEYGELKWFCIENLARQKVIPSDSWLIQNKLNTKSAVTSARMKMYEETLSKFSID